jgi:type I restriction enzyme M protein
MMQKKLNGKYLEDNYKSIIPDEYRWRNWAPDNKDGKAITGEEMSYIYYSIILQHLKDLEINETYRCKKSD